MTADIELYHYVHCPYCIRVRFVLGYLNIPFKSTVLPYNDEQTPIKLSGVKMLPILRDGNHIMNESLDIIDYLDSKNALAVKETTQTKEFEHLTDVLNKISGPLHSLAMPYWIYTAEFDAESRKYFQAKKEIKRGPFRDLLAKKNDFVIEVQSLLNNLEEDLRPYYHSEHLTLKDIVIASHLWGLYIVPEFQFTDRMNLYLQKIKEECRFDYHVDFRSFL